VKLYMDDNFQWFLYGLIWGVFSVGSVWILAKLYRYFRR